MEHRSQPGSILRSRSEIRDKRRPPPGSTAWSDGLSRRLWLLESDALVAEAMRRTRLEDFGDPPIEPALSILANSLELEADLHPLGRLLMKIHLRELLETRLRLVDAWSGQLDALNAQLVQRPVFITGMPRSGSTFLHELMAEDPENRAPRVWEVMLPVPAHNGADAEGNARARKTEACLWWFRRLAPGADAVYPMRARTPHECVAIHSYTLLSEEFVSLCPIPTYEAFLRAADLGLSYGWQKRFLQYLQLGHPNRRWVLKSPDHVRGLEPLLRVFPDAMIIQTHRNPLEALRSGCQLTEVLQRMFARVGDRHEFGAREVRMLAESMECITRFRDSHPELAEHFMDVTYREVVADPMAVVRRVYERLGRRLTEAAAERMQRLIGNRSRYRTRNASLTLADLGLDGPDVARQFEGYCSRFGVSCRQGK